MPDNPIKEHLQKLSAMYEVARAITSTLDLKELLVKISESATTLLNAKGCIIRLLEGDKLVIKASYGLPKEIEKMMTLTVGEGIPGMVVKEHKPILVEDLSSMPDEWKIPYLDARPVINVPLIASGEVIGTLGLYDKRLPDDSIIPFTQDDLTAAEGVGSLSAIAIEKARLFELVLQRESDAVKEEKRLNVLFDSVQGGIITIKRDYTIISANRYVERWTEIPSGLMIGRNSLEVFHEGKGICPHCVSKQTFYSGQINAITQKAGLNYAELTSYPVKDEAGQVEECVVFIQDITDRILYQEEVLQLYREVTQTKEYPKASLTTCRCYCLF